jgi:MFS superfamily sulfate permease-like transporter/carbonic anhydrase
MQKLLDGLRHYQQHLFREKRALFEQAVRGQKPTAMLITCSDSRVLPESLLQADPGDLFVSRNAGNMIPPPETESGEAASIEYAVDVLGVTDFIICSHYRCGAVKAIIEEPQDGVLPMVSNWLKHASVVKEEMLRDYTHLSGDLLWDKAVERNTIAQLGNLKKHAPIAAGIVAGRVRVHAWVLRFETSEIRVYDEATENFRSILEEEQEPGISFVEQQCVAKVPAELATVRNADASKVSWFDVLKSDLPSSFVVFAVAMPMCIAIARALGMPAAAGIITGALGGIIAAFIRGGKFQVSGPTAGLVMVGLSVIDQRGAGAIGIVVLLAGLLQLVAGILRLGKVFRVVSPAIILGMLAGIGAMLASQQIHVAMDHTPARNTFVNLWDVPRALIGIFDEHGHKAHLPAAMLGLVTLNVILMWKQIVPCKLAIIPGVVAGIALATLISQAGSFEVQKVEFTGLNAGVNLIDITQFQVWIQDGFLWRMAFAVAIVASAESLLTAAAVDRMHQGPRTHNNRELAAQGIGNVVCGAIGVLPMASVIVRSSANVQAGAKTYWSTVFHGVWLLAFALIVPDLISIIPMAALAAVLVLTGLKLIQYQSIKKLCQESWSEGVICAATFLGVVGIDILSGVLIGLGLSIAKLIYVFTKLFIRSAEGIHRDSSTVVLEGAATFLRLPQLAAHLESIPAVKLLFIDTQDLIYIDHSCMKLLHDWEKRLEAAGGKLIVDWEIIQQRSRGVMSRAFLQGPHQRRQKVA